MNKQELIAAIEKEIHPKPPNEYQEGVADGMNHSLRLVEQLDESAELTSLRAEVERLTPKWVAEPTESGWHFVEGTDSVYRLYESAIGCWNAEGLFHLPIAGRRVCKIMRPE